MPTHAVRDEKQVPATVVLFFRLADLNGEGVFVVLSAHPDI
jgi:hypothetical protein